MRQVLRHVAAFGLLALIVWPAVGAGPKAENESLNKARAEEALKIGESLLKANEASSTAIIAFSEAIRLSPTYAEAYRARGVVYGTIWKFDKAIEDTTEAIRLKPKDAESYCVRGKVYYQKGDFDKAFTDYAEAIRIDPRCGAAYIGRGEVYERKYADDKAIATYKEAVPLEPIEAHSHLAAIFGCHNDFNRAVAEYTTAIQLDPQNWRFYLHRGGVYEMLNAPEKVIADYTDAIRLVPKSVAFDAASAYRTRGDFYHKKGDFDKAIADYTEAIRIDPFSPSVTETLSSRASAYAEKGNLDKAIAEYTEIIRLRPDKSAYCGRGVTYQRWGKFDEAISDFTKVLRDIREDAEMIQKGKMPGASRYHARTLQEDRMLARWAYKLRGLAYESQGNHDKAIADYTETIRLSPEDADAYHGRGIAYQNKGDKEKAEEDFAEAKRFGYKPSPSP